MEVQTPDLGAMIAVPIFLLLTFVGFTAPLAVIGAIQAFAYEAPTWAFWIEVPWFIGCILALGEI